MSSKYFYISAEHFIRNKYISEGLYGEVISVNSPVYVVAEKKAFENTVSSGLEIESSKF